MLAGLLLFITCRKMDYSPRGANGPSLNSITDKFFNSHRSNDPTEKALIDYLKRINEKDKFVETTVKHIGFPRWDKILTPSFSRYAGRTESDSSAITYYIPFVRDSQNYVNASMAIRTTPSDTTFSYLCDWQYSQLQNNTASYQDTAEYFAIFFMTLDKSVFGYNRFNITDKNLFKNGNNEARFITLSNPNSNRNNLAELLMPIEVCQSTNTYYTVCAYPGHPRCTPNCDECWECTAVLQLTYCWTEWVDDGSGGGSGGNTGGTGGTGGGSSGGSTPPPCPNTPAARTENVTNPCTGGWTPDPNTGTANYSNNPCTVVDSLLKTNSYPQLLNNLRDSTPIHHEIGYSFTLPDTSNNTHTYYAGQGSLAVNIDPTSPVDGIMHNHYDTAGRHLIFSAEDITYLAQLFVRNEISDLKTFTFTLVTDSTAYILMISDSTKFRNFVNAWLNTDKHMENFGTIFYDTYNVAGNGLTVAQKEKNFLDVLKKAMQFASQDGIGLKLFRGNSDMTIFSPIKLNSNGQVRPDPCQ